jgi:hypothetical protein
VPRHLATNHICDTEILKQYFVSCSCGMLKYVRSCCFDRHCLRAKDSRITFMIASGILFLQGILYRYGQPHLQILSLLDGNFLWRFPLKLRNKYPLHRKHTFDLWQFAFCSLNGVFYNCSSIATDVKTWLLKYQVLKLNRLPYILKCGHWTDT